MSKNSDIEECTEYARSTDDGNHQDLHRDADVLLLGVSGVGKTALCSELARRGVKAANIPIYGNSPKSESISKIMERGSPLVIGLVCHWKVILQRRGQRRGWNAISQHLYGTDHGSEHRYFEDRELALDDVKKANRLYRELGCETLDISGDSPEKAAEQIIKLLPQRPASTGATPERRVLRL
ncbi:MAG: kinase/pyrophosphorylase [Alphaproteobacteria bacterium]|nr:kinase/pyrophosphorylase [Alphaproteobacteria bacterium]